VFAGYSGHLVEVFQYIPAASANHWQRIRIVDGRLTTNSLTLSVDWNSVPAEQKRNPIYISVQIHVDTKVPPGLYDDFVLRRLGMTSPGFVHYASLGFDFRS
jgi:hypothetical protein